MPDPQSSSLLRRLGPAGALGIAWALVPALGGFVLLASIGSISDWLAARGSLGLGLYVGLFVVAAGCGLLPTYAQAVLGGWVFGLAVGIPAALLGFTGAAILGYLITRLVARERAERVIREHPRALAVRDALIGRGFWRTLGIVTLVRVPPNSPFALTNLVLASSGVRPLVFALGTMIGMTPRTIVAIAFAAAAAGTGARDIQTFVKDGPGALVMVGGIVVMLIVLVILGRIGNAAIQRVVPGAAPTAPPVDPGAS